MDDTVAGSIGRLIMKRKGRETEDSITGTVPNTNNHKDETTSFDSSQMIKPTFRCSITDRPTGHCFDAHKVEHL